MRHAGARCASGGEKAVARGRLNEPYAGKSLAGGRGEGTRTINMAFMMSVAPLGPRNGNTACATAQRP